MNDVLITGANGFVGANLAETLIARGSRVTGLVRKSSKAERLERTGAKITRFTGFDDVDSLDRAMAGKSVVFHLAGATKALEPQKLYEANQEGTRGLFEACSRQPKPPVVVHVSSLAAAGPSSLDRPKKESDPAMPVSHYGKSKRAGELVARSFADRVPTSIVRPAIVLGPGDVEGFAMFQPVYRFGVHGCPRSGHDRFSIIFVADLCELLIAAAERGERIESEEDGPESRARGVYFGACSEFPTYAELGPMLRDAVGRRRVFCLPFPMPMIWAVASGVEIISRVIGRPLYLKIDKAREIAAGSWTCSPKAAIDQLGFQPTVSLRDRLRETAKWYFKNGWLKKHRLPAWQKRRYRTAPQTRKVSR